VQRPRLQGQSLEPELVLVPALAEEQELEAALAAEQEVVVEEQAVEV
jgi:hypothetical protein